MHTSLIIALSALAAACGDNVIAAPDPAVAIDAARAAPAPQPVRHTAIVSTLAGVINTGWVADWAGFASTSRGCMRSYSFGRFAVPLPLEEGDRMLSLTFSAIGNFSADLDVYSLSAAPAGDLTLGTIGSLGVPNVLGGDPHDFTIDLVDTLVTGGVSWWFEFSADQAGICVGALRLTYERSL